MGGGVSFYVQALRNWWWLILTVPTLSVLAAVHFTSQQTPLFRASAEVAVVPSPELTEPADVMRGLETLERRTVIATFASMAETRETLSLAAAKLGLTSSDIARYRVQASVVPRTNIIRISVEGRDGDRVSQLANTVARVLAEESKTTYQIFEMKSLEAALPARGPFHPDPRRNAMVASILGLFGGLFSALAVDFLRAMLLRRGSSSDPTTRFDRVPDGDIQEPVPALRR